MKRIFKFRVWDIKGEKFQECYDIGLNGEFAHVAISDHCYLINEEGKEPEFVLQQFTGLLDKNGREIYEGDVLKQTHGYIDIDEREWVGFVYFQLGEFAGMKMAGFALKTKNINFKIHETCEVIGNMFENKELLE